MANKSLRMFDLRDYKAIGCIPSCFIIRQIEFWSDVKSANKSSRSPFFDPENPTDCGIYRSVEEWKKDLPMFKEKTFQRAFRHLVRIGILNIHHEGGKRRRWFALHEDKLTSIRSVKEQPTMKLQPLSYSLKGSFLLQFYESHRPICPPKEDGHTDSEAVHLSTLRGPFVRSNGSPTLYITETIQRHLCEMLRILENIDFDFLEVAAQKQFKLDEFKAIWDLYHLFTMKPKRDKARALKKWSKYSHSVQQRFFARFGDYLLDRSFEGFTIMEEPQSKYNKSFIKFMEEFCVDTDNPYTQEYFDGKFKSARPSRAKSKPKTPGKRSANIVAMSLHEQFKAKKAQAGYDPLVGS